MPAIQARLQDESGCADGAVPCRRMLVLCRIGSGNSAGAAHVIRDLSPMFSHRLSPAEWRAAANREIEALVDMGLAEISRNRLSLTERGILAVEAYLGRKGVAGSSWNEVRDGWLVAKGLGLDAPGPKRLKALLSPDGLRAAVLQNKYGLSGPATPTVAKLRAQLAVLALERAFGSKIKNGLGAGSGFSAKAGRLLAGQLSTRPRDLGSDARLVAALAAEAVDARQTDADALRTAILRRLVDADDAAPAVPDREEVPSAKRPSVRPVDVKRAEPRQQNAANDAGLPGAAVPPNRRPDPKGFAAAVQAAARTCAEGWAGNRKALISRVWEKIAAAHPEWRISDVEFKAMLAECHRTGYLRLATADLKDKERQQEIEASAISYMNTKWHLIRVAETD